MTTSAGQQVSIRAIPTDGRPFTIRGTSGVLRRADD